ncbi:MAG TPA: hypothetical protein VFI68_14565 [Anaerolineales bacterium]|nr:hypothetical protein [Anaerolineales bacterium]
MKQVSILLLSSFLLFSCAPAEQPSGTEVVHVYATFAAQPWLTELYACAADLSVVLNVNADGPDIYLRVGEPEVFISPVYQIDEEEILIVTNRESSIQNLSLEEAQDLFARGDPSAQVWVYASGEDVQIVFDQLVMEGRNVTSLAKMATSPQQMSDLVNLEKDAVGIIPRHWKVGTVRDVFSAGFIPVLAVTKEEPSGTVMDLISCMQN